MRDKFVNYMCGLVTGACIMYCVTGQPLREQIVLFNNGDATIAINRYGDQHNIVIETVRNTIDGKDDLFKSGILTVSQMGATIEQEWKQNTPVTPRQLAYALKGALNQIQIQIKGEAP